MADTTPTPATAWVITKQVYDDTKALAVTLDEDIAEATAARMAGVEPGASTGDYSYVGVPLLIEPPETVTLYTKSARVEANGNIVILEVWDEFNDPKDDVATGTYTAGFDKIAHTEAARDESSEPKDTGIIVRVSGTDRAAVNRMFAEAARRWRNHYFEKAYGEESDHG